MNDMTSSGHGSGELRDPVADRVGNVALFAVVPSAQGRLDRLRNIMVEREIQGLLISDLANIRYLSGFSGSAALMLVTGDRALITTDSRYAVQIEEEIDLAGVSGSMDIAISSPSNQDGQKHAIVEMVRSSCIDHLALEADKISWHTKKRWLEVFQEVKINIGLQPATGLVEQLRTVKDGMEISLMHHAAAMADAALGKVYPMLDEHPQEKDFALELDWWMRKLGADDRAFETIVAAGPNGAKPHAQPSSRKIENEDAVVVDFGASFMGYCSDMTRTLCGAGKLSGEMAGVYDVVVRSQQAGIDTLRAGVKCSDVDRACREVIEDAGYGDKFAHSTGHGVGLYVHESPVLGTRSEDVLQAGMVVTVPATQSTSIPNTTPTTPPATTG